VNATAFAEGYKIKAVIPAQAGIHTVSQVALCYGFPLARERKW
jgi:hypothetical protein